MNLLISFTTNGWEDYLYWQGQNKKTLKRINLLLKDCLRDPKNGIGKPEPLRHELSDAWSRRIDDEHRLVYLVTHTEIQVLAARYHY